MHEVSVITVNYNGSRLLPRLLESLRRLTCPSFETVVVDNRSSDASVELVREGHPWVRLIQASGNLGFAGGNNLGIRETSAPFVALINNDAFPEPDWLERLLAAAGEDETIGAVTSKILFDRPFVPVLLRSRGAGSHGRIVVGPRCSFDGCDYDKLLFGDGFGGWAAAGGVLGRVVEGQAELLVPLGEPEPGSEVRLNLELVATGERPGEAEVEVDGRPVATLEVPGRADRLRIGLPAELARAAAVGVINNVGTILDDRGDPADRGIHEIDVGQYEEAVDVPAMCGAAVLLRRAALDRVGLFDRDFFMYYEDTDLSWRLRADGWRIRYEPSAVVRHLHAASSVERSPTFDFYTARNRVLTLAKNASPGRFLRGYARELGVLARLTGRTFRDGLRGDGTSRRDLETRLQVHRSLVRQIPRALRKRWDWLED